MYKKRKSQCKKGENVFPRIDSKKVLEDIKKEDEKKVEDKKEVDTVKYISIDDLDKIELKVGEIVEAEKVEGSNKLYKLQVDLGKEKRQIVSGIAKYYSLEELLHKKVVVVTNLKPVTLCKVESFGMLLAAGDSEVVKLLTVDGDIESGESIH